MSRNYSRNTFLRQTPNKILKEYLTRKGLLAGIDFDDTHDITWDLRQGIRQFPVLLDSQAAGFLVVVPAIPVVMADNRHPHEASAWLIGIAVHGHGRAHLHLFRFQRPAIRYLLRKP